MPHVIKLSLDMFSQKNDSNTQEMQKNYWLWRYGKQMPDNVNSSETKPKFYVTEKEMSVIKELFKNNPEFEIIVIEMVSGYSDYGNSFGFSEELIEILSRNGFNYEKISNNMGKSNKEITLRTSNVLIESILKIGFEKAGNQFYGKKDTILFKLIPRDYIDCIEIDSHNFEASESVEFRLDIAIKNILSDQTLDQNQKIKKITEVTFIDILFNRMNYNPFDEASKSYFGNNF